MPKIRNIIIFVAILAALILAYILFFKPSSSDQTSLVSSSGNTTSTTASSVDTSNINTSSPADASFIKELLNVKTITLKDDIFSDPAFNSLHDSSIVLVPDATTGRPNPFAQFGTGSVAAAPVVAPAPTSTTPAPAKTTTPAKKTTSATPTSQTNP